MSKKANKKKRNKVQRNKAKQQVHSVKVQTNAELVQEVKEDAAVLQHTAVSAETKKDNSDTRQQRVLVHSLYHYMANKKWLAVVLPLLICVFAYFCITKVVPKMSVFCKEYTICDATEKEILLSDEVMLVQDFEMPFDAMNGIDVYFKKADGNLKGKIKLQLAQKDGKTLYTWSVREDLLEDDGFQRFSMGKVVKVNKGERYVLRIYSEDNDEQVAKVVTSKKDQYEQGSLTIDGEQQKGDLAFRVFGKYDGASQKSLFTLIFAVFAVLFVMCFYALAQKKMSCYMQSVEWLDWLLFGVAALASALLFSQYADLEITIKHSEDLISIIKNGTFFQFYDIVLDKAMDGGYGPATFLNAANYNIFLYLALSIIIFPFVLLKKLFGWGYEYYMLVAYVQCALLVLDVVAAWLLAKVCIAFGADKKYAKVVAYLFLSSSITIFATVGFGQLDIIYIIVLLASLLFFAKKQYYRFSLIMSVAIMLKSFPILFFVPLILLTHKKVWQIAVHMVLGVSSSLVFKVMFGGTQGYSITKEKMNASYNFMERLVDCNIHNKYSAISLFIVAYVILCIWAYSRKVTAKETVYSYMVWIGVFVYGAFAILTLWHPQWLVILALFMALAIPQFENQKLALYCDLGIQIMYLAASNIYFLCNVDNYMVNRGVLVWLTGHCFDGAAIRQIAEQMDHTLTMVFSVLVAILIAFIYYAFKQIEKPRLAIAQVQCERIIVWVRLAVMYAYCLMLCVFFFYLG